MVAAFSGPVPWITRVVGAVLHAGRDAAVAGRTALRLHGVLDARDAGADPHHPDEPIEVCVPHDRRVARTAGMSVRRCRDLGARVQQVPFPPRLRVEEAVLDVADTCTDLARVLALVLAAVQRRRTTAARLREALGKRSRHRWRPLLLEVLAEAADGVHSMLERRYLRDVERAHGLPRAERQHRDRTSAGTRYRDLRYRAQQLVVELDGAAAHPEHSRSRDDARGRGIVLTGDVPMVYGWTEVAGDPCGTAAEVVEVLTARGWAGTPHPCSRPRCHVPRGPAVSGRRRGASSRCPRARRCGSARRTDRAGRTWPAPG